MTIGGREAGIRSSPCSATIDADVEAASVSDRINHHRGLGVSPRRKIGGRRRANTDNRTDGNNGKGSILNFSQCPLQHFGANDESAFAVATQRRALARFSNCCIMACRREARARPVAQVATATPAFLPTPANDFHSHSSQPPSETIDFGGVLTKPPDACIIHMDDAMWECGGGSGIGVVAIIGSVYSLHLSPCGRGTGRLWRPSLRTPKRRFGYVESIDTIRPEGLSSIDRP